MASPFSFARHCRLAFPALGPRGARDGAPVPACHFPYLSLSIMQSHLNRQANSAASAWRGVSRTSGAGRCLFLNCLPRAGGWHSLPAIWNHLCIFTHRKMVGTAAAIGALPVSSNDTMPATRRGAYATRAPLYNIAS